MTRLLIAHGSPDERHLNAMQDLAVATGRRDGIHTCVAFLEHNSPTVVQRVSGVGTDEGLLDTLGLFLTDGYHARIDVPKVLADAAEHRQLRDHGTLGMGSWLLPALTQQVRESGANPQDRGTGLVLAAAGSARAEARQQVVTLAAAWQRERCGPVRPAFVSGPGPSLDEAFAMLNDAGCHKRAVALLMLAPGVLADRVVSFGNDHGVPVSAPLGTADEVVDEILVRTYEAAS